jgi:hypothetical protein
MLAVSCNKPFDLSLTERRIPQLMAARGDLLKAIITI